MKKILSLFVVALAAATLVACGKPVVKTGTGYGLVHKHYVAEVIVETKNDKLTAVTYEEYFLPYNLGEVKAYEVAPENVLVVGSKYFAKFMLVDGELFTAEVAGTNVSYKNAAKVDIEVVVKDEAKAKAYVEALKAGKVFIVDSAEATTKSTVLISKKTEIDKTADNYWPEGVFGLGWKANMDALSEAFIKYGVDATFTLNSETKKWETTDGTTSATLSDFVDYQAVTKRAVQNAN